MEECCRVEALATPKLLYLKDAAEYYFDETRGDLTCAFVGDRLAGFGKLSLLCDGSAWLEALRVDPAFQGMGVARRFTDASWRKRRSWEPPPPGCTPAFEPGIRRTCCPDGL